MGEIDQEIDELFRRLNNDPPAPRTLSSFEANQVSRFVRQHQELMELASSGIERFLGNVGRLPDGRPVFVFRGKSAKQGWHTILPRGLPFGAYLKLYTATNVGPRQVVLLPNSDAFAGLREGRFIVTFTRLGRITEVLEYDYTTEVCRSILTRMLDHAETIQREIEADPTYIPDVALICAMSIDDRFFASELLREDWLQIGWASEAERLYRLAAKMIATLKAEPTSVLASSEFPHASFARSAIAKLQSEKPAGQRLVDLIILFEESDKTGEYLLDLLSIGKMISNSDWNDCVVVCLDALNASSLSPKATRWGRQLLTYSNFSRQLTALPIDPAQFPISSDSEAREFWEHQPFMVSFDGQEYLSPSDFPAHWRTLKDYWDEHPPLINSTEAVETARRLIEEASALKKWTIPRNAYVDLRVGPFHSVELTELGNEIYFMWRDEKERYWRCSIGTDTFSFDNIAPYSSDDRVSAMLKIVMAALVRDFWVVEERHRVFDVVRRRYRRGKSGETSRFVYLPRVRYQYDSDGPTRITLGLQQGARARHFVNSFLRKVRPTPLQLEIARSQRIVVPEGHTYVRAHYRGGSVNQTIYRSRSAMQLLYEASDQPEITPAQDDWFEFERMTALLLEKHLGFTVLSRAPRGGDGGIDIRATKSGSGRTEIWVVQCKCWAENSPVGPSVVRELIGTMADAFREPEQVVRGMVVTSSRFTPEARRLAVHHGIQTIDAEDLVDICAAVNRASTRTHGN